MVNDSTLPVLCERDVRAILRLLGEVAEIEGFTAQKQALLNGLSILIDADSWAWATTCKFAPNEVPVSSGFLSGGFSPAQYAKFQEALEHPDTGMLNAHFTNEFAQKRTHLTRLRDQIDVDNQFPQTQVFHIWKEAGVEHVLLSIRPGREAGGLSQIGIYRRPGRQPFTSRESRIAHIVLSEVPWLHEAMLPPDLNSGVMQIAPRERITLNLLLEGQSRRQIAAHLGISENTVGGYVKSVFRHFGVHSQPELIARFRVGDGGDLR